MKICSLLLSLYLLVFITHTTRAQTTDEGQTLFESACARCHGGDARGGESGPAILFQVSTRSDAALAEYLRVGTPANGMPPLNVADRDMNQLIGYLRSMVPIFAPGPGQVDRRLITLADGTTLEGEVLNEGFTDLQLRDEGGALHLLRKLPNSRFREVTSQQDWSGYNGDPGGNRFTQMTQINKDNVAQVAPLWTFPIPNARQVETTPVVVEGVMYVSSANEVWALDAGTGREIWHYQQARTQGLTGNAAIGFNRGVAVANDRVFLLTDHVHLIALDASDGSLLWDTEMADWTQNYNGTSAPLVVGDLVVSGHAGGDEGVRGFVAAYDTESGAEVWRRWTVPLRGEPGSETWGGDAIEHGAGATWMTGTYDAELDIVYWPTGNPGPDFNGDNRIGDNLYTDSILALQAQTGELLWYYQFTPHDIHDWDAQEPPVLIDTQWQGQQRKLLIQANRNGFFYVLDRTDGELLLAEQFLEKLNWAEGIGEDGRPILRDLPLTPTGETYVCPGFQGGTNWYSTSYNPNTGLYYFQALERCNLFSKRDIEWMAGSGFMGGTARQAPGETFQKSVRAVDIQTGDVVFDIQQAPAPSTASAGLISTASNLIFFGENSGSFVAADAATGEVLWEHPTNQAWKASPMTYMFDNKQYIGVAVGTTITAFGVRE
ncbi:PQQ-binding-like beta-propeller repeat protein [Gammaproteobacteria bacterium]|nr:PQQ-binding-like beta-propeller repeat protein [Gammaproteobacteria bacterium]